jgi:hypothetical protein
MNGCADSIDNEITNETNDLCSICLSELGDNEYTLDCNHTFHTKCIVEWFRKSKGNCPLCNDNPGGPWPTCQIGYFGRDYVNQRCGLIRRKFGRKNDCPIPLKKALDRLKDLETEHKVFVQEKIEFMKLEETIKYKKLIREYGWTGSSKHNNKINKQKIKIIGMLPAFIIT